MITTEEKTLSEALKEKYNLKEVNYYVILSIDIPKGSFFRRYYDKDILKKFDLQITEAGESDYIEGYKHRKLVSQLTEDQLQEFIDEFYLYPEDVMTMGSLTIEYGLLPAVSFNAEDYEYGACINCYISPLFLFNEPIQSEKIFNDEDYIDINWDDIHEMIIEYFK